VAGHADTGDRPRVSTGSAAAPKYDARALAVPLPTAAAPRAATPPANTLMTVREAAQHLRKAERTVRLYVQQGRLRSYRVGGSVRFDRADLDALVVVR